MNELNQTITSALSARYQKLAGVVHNLAEPLSDSQFWTKPFSFGNSFGHLVLHLTGNLNYYIGGQIAHTGYQRDRPLEFSDATQPTKDAVLQKFDEAIAIVVDAINRQSPEDWAKPYDAVGTDANDRIGIVLSCATHLHLHIGQLMYLGFALKQRS
jgi:hypothetical protein